MSYAHQKLKNAVEALREQYASKRQWLAGNDVYHVLHLAPEELPHDVRADFEHLHADAHVIGMRENVSRQYDIAHQLPDADVERLSGTIVELYYHVDAAVCRRAPHPRGSMLTGMR
ncbi:MAG TPA: hypothetical protein VHL60_03370 [Oxalicibacterium sp.]|jgi:hypothetical protein|nr:hypothetical protein [Oxalicibacterium sp.]